MKPVPSELCLIARNDNVEKMGEPHIDHEDGLDFLCEKLLYMQHRFTNPHRHLPEDFLCFAHAALSFLKDLHDRNVVRAIRPYYVVHPEAHESLQEILVEVLKQSHYYCRMAWDYKGLRNGPHDWSFFRLEGSSFHVAACELSNKVYQALDRIHHYAHDTSARVARLLDAWALLTTLEGPPYIEQSSSLSTQQQPSIEPQPQAAIDIPIHVEPVADDQNYVQQQQQQVEIIEVMDDQGFDEVEMDNEVHSDNEKQSDNEENQQQQQT